VGILGSPCITNDANLGLDLTEAGEIPVEIGLVEIVVEHEDRDIDVAKVAILDPTVFASTSDEPEGKCLSRKWSSMKEPDVLGSTSDFDGERVLLACSFGGSLDPGPVVGMLAFRILMSVLECVESRRRGVRCEVELVVADALG
jgi:hypothetical protein